MRKHYSYACVMCNFWLFSTAMLAIVGGVLVGSIEMWLKEKSYVFTAERVATITTDVLNTSKGDHEIVFAMVEEVLREQYPRHIIPHTSKEWLFMNAGGWMGSFCLLHASLTEYVLFFGTAINTSGHSGRYWANISDIVISGEFRQWMEGTTKSIVYTRGDTIFHMAGEATAVQWKEGTWMVEYGRGFIPSSLGFALSDTIWSTTDYYTLYRTIRMYVIALIQEIWCNGNF